MDLRGRLVVQAVESLPIHIASMNGLMECLLEKFGDDICQGDIFVANDPHSAGGTHLPDINLATPVYLEGELQGFVCNIAHHADVGGMNYVQLQMDYDFKKAVKKVISGKCYVDIGYVWCL